MPDGEIEGFRDLCNAVPTDDKMSRGRIESDVSTDGRRVVCVFLGPSPRHADFRPTAHLSKSDLLNAVKVHTT